jgi:ABC-2 type transport system permease protein
MFGRLKVLFRKEFVQVLRDKRLRFFIIVPPVIQLLVFGYVVTMDVNHVPTVVLDGDRSAASREVVRRFEASGYFTVIRSVASENELQLALDRGDAECALHFTRGFGRDLRKGGPAMIQVILDGTNSNTASVVQGYVNQITASLQRQRFASLGAAVRPAVDLRIRAWYNPDLRSKNYNVPAVMATIITLVCLMLTSMAVVREREMGTMEQLMVSPLRPGELMLGKTIPFAVISFFDMLLVIIVGVLWFDVPVNGSPVVLLVGTLLYLLSVLGVGLFISTFARSQQQALMSTILFYMPSILLSGFVFPIKNMPVLFQYLTYVIPLRYFLVIIRGVFLKSVGFVVLWPEMAALLVIGLVVITISSIRFRKRMG